MTTYIEPIRRSYERTTEQLRPVTIETGTMPAAEGSATISIGKTVVLCSASVEERTDPVARFTAGMLGYRTQRLKSITTLIGSDVVRAYRIAYEQNRADRQSRPHRSWSGTQGGRAPGRRRSPARWHRANAGRRAGCAVGGSAGVLGAVRPQPDAVADEGRRLRP